MSGNWAWKGAQATQSIPGHPGDAPAGNDRGDFLCQTGCSSEPVIHTRHDNNTFQRRYDQVSMQSIPQSRLLDFDYQGLDEFG